MVLAYTIRLDVTKYESDLIKEGLKVLLQHRYKVNPELEPEQKEYIADRVKNIQKLYDRIERLQAEL